jgi:DNA-binding NarL/FixJ family response regulator
MAISLLIAEDQRLIRAGLRNVLQQDEGIRVVGEAASGREVIDLAERLDPDVILMDLVMPELSGIEATRELAARRLRARVIAVSSHTTERWIRRALAAGVCGYVTKTDSAEALTGAVHAVHAGRLWLCEDASTALRASSSIGDDPLDRLSPRQKVVLQRIAEGQTSRAIAAELGVSERTIDTHRSELMRRLDLHDVASVVLFACRQGLVSVD